MNQPISPQKKSGSLYPYQQADLDTIFDRIANRPNNFRLLYQLPTGGGKTVVFSEIVQRYTDLYRRNALVLTHRNELCSQTSRTLKSIGVKNMMITSSVNSIPETHDVACFVAMVETLKNRIREGKLDMSDIGLVIIDEAHHNSFRKLFSQFKNAFIIGVTATPLSADASKPMKRDYRELIVGESIPDLIDKGFLARAVTYGYDVELSSLKVGSSGDFTRQSSDALYTSSQMLDLLFESYKAKASGRKTLIFNNGIRASKKVLGTFRKAGLPIMHLDNKTPAAERAAILKWFKKTPGSILTSVSLLTTGFDEPSVETVILNRATQSLTLYFQMIGRGSRKIKGKQSFIVIDLGNNASRFGLWTDDVDWKKVYENPEDYLYTNADSSEAAAKYHMPLPIRQMFPKTVEFDFDVEAIFEQAVKDGKKPKFVMSLSIRQHALMCVSNADTIPEARKLAEALEPDIDHRVKEYATLLEKTTKSYRDWLSEDYRTRLSIMIGKIFNKIEIEARTGLRKL